MLLAGALSWANLRMRPVRDTGDIVVPEEILEDGAYGMQWGWPFCFYERIVPPDSFDPWLTPLASWPTEFHWPALVCDVAVAVAILLGGAMLSESLLRRSRGSSTSPPPL
jgi:hypothetical protein